MRFASFVVILVICSVVSGSPLYTSSVFVQRGADVVPIEYLEYAPSFIPRAQLQQISAASVGSSAAYKAIPPCVSPCILETPTAAKIVAYQPPLPKVSLAYDGGYQYSYLVYDDQTGDQKAQQEISDGSVVRGQYSFIQPDGLIREVRYRAGDDGFNAIVKNFPPTTGGDTKSDAKADCKTNEGDNSKADLVTETASTEEPKKEEIKDAVEETTTPSTETTEDKTVTTVPATTTTQTAPVPEKIYLTFEDLIRCAQMKIAANVANAATTENIETQTSTDSNIEKTALTYIVFPALTGSPC